MNLCTPLTETTAIKRYTSSNASHISPESPAFPTVHSNRAHTLVIFDQFLSDWTTIVGDPIMSKWIIITLGVSILLNGFLLKGIASGSALGSSSGGGAAAAAAVLLGAWEIVDWNNPLDQPAPGSTPARNQNVNLRLSLERETGLLKYQRDHHRDAQAHILAPLPTRSDPLTTPTNGPAKPIEKPMPTLVVSSSTPIDKVILGGPSDRPALDGLANGNGPVPISKHTALGMRSIEECQEIMKGGLGAYELNDEELILLTQKGKIPPYSLEKALQNCERAVKIRRAVICWFSPFFFLCSSGDGLTFFPFQPERRRRKRWKGPTYR